MSNEHGGDGRIRDAAVDAAWSAASTEEPSAQTDEAILAAARAETRSATSSWPGRRRTPWWSHWQPLAAAAGVAGLAFLVVQRLPTEPDRQHTLQAPTVAPAVPSATARPEAVAVEDVPLPAELPAPQPAEQRLRVEGVPERPPAQGRVEITSEPPVAPAPTVRAAPSSAFEGPPRQVAQPFPAEVEDQAGAVTNNAARESSALVAHEQAAGVAAAKAEVDAAGPEASVRRIVALHDAGDLAAASDELRAFRRAYPDADVRLPTSLRTWASTVDQQGDR